MLRYGDFNQNQPKETIMSNLFEIETFYINAGLTVALKNQNIVIDYREYDGELEIIAKFGNAIATFTMSCEIDFGYSQITIKNPVFIGATHLTHNKNGDIQKIIEVDDFESLENQLVYILENANRCKGIEYPQNVTLLK